MAVSNVQIPFGKWARSVQPRLNYEYETSKSVLNHSSALGKIREAVIQDILKSFLPSSVEITTGQVIDHLGNLSKQIDIVISRGNTPTFRFEGGLSAILYEATLATIEVKSMLYRDKLHEALDNSKSVKDLTYMLHARAKGKQLIEEAFQWVDSAGGIDIVENKILNQSLDTPINCPEDIWSILNFIRYWIHWSNGDFSSSTKVQRLMPLTETPQFRLFINLLQFILSENDIEKVFQVDFQKAEKIKEDFFDKLYECELFENLPPDTFILAYGGYETLENMVTEVKNWYEQNRPDTDWYDLPRVIVNHKMFMYRHYNEYHCGTFEYPILFFMNGICRALTQDLAFPVSIGATTQISRYFDIPGILGDEHPKNSPSYLIWTIPIDNSSAGEIKRMND